MGQSDHRSGVAQAQPVGGETAAQDTGQSPRVHIKSYGCQMNVYDARRMADILSRDGFSETQNPEDADLIILNTCHIREKAAEKLYSDLGRLRALKHGMSAPRIAVAGCVAQAEGREILARAPGVDMVVGPQSYHRLPAILEEARRRPGVVATEFAAAEKLAALAQPGLRRRQGVSAFLTVQEGCDKFCTFCVVPYTRGAEISRPAADVIEEARRLIDAGAREITLLGQNVNAYHGEGPDGHPWTLARLLWALAELPGILRLRYTTSHPRDMTLDLIAAHGSIDRLMPSLHLPVQSGSDRVLAAMNRKHGADDYRRIVDALRAARPDIALSSDFIVGFPGETDADFEATVSLVTEIGFACAYSFKYSPRPGTPGAERTDQVPESVKSERLARLQPILNAQQQAINGASVGATVPVLLEKPGRHAGQAVGRTPHSQSVAVEGAAPLLAGSSSPQEHWVRITGLSTYGLIGTLAGRSGRDAAPGDSQWQEAQA